MYTNSRSSLQFDQYRNVLKWNGGIHIDLIKMRKRLYSSYATSEDVGPTLYKYYRNVSCLTGHTVKPKHRWQACDLAKPSLATIDTVGSAGFWDTIIDWAHLPRWTCWQGNVLTAINREVKRLDREPSGWRLSARVAWQGCDLAENWEGDATLATLSQQCGSVRCEPAGNRTSVPISMAAILYARLRPRLDYAKLDQLTAQKNDREHPLRAFTSTKGPRFTISASDTLSQCWINDGPSSSTLAQH